MSKDYTLLDKYKLCHRCEKAKVLTGRKFCQKCLEEMQNRAADMWHDPENTINEIIETLGRKQHDFYLLRVQNPELFPPRRAWKRRRV